jgi:hypothetical protein
VRAVRTQPRSVAIALWLSASVCLALALLVLDDWGRWLALAGYVVFQGGAIFYPRTQRRGT